MIGLKTAKGTKQLKVKGGIVVVIIIIIINNSNNKYMYFNDREWLPNLPSQGLMLNIQLGLQQYPVTLVNHFITSILKSPVIPAI